MEDAMQYLETIKNPTQRERMKELLLYVKDNFPTLHFRIAWSQPIFEDHGTFIIGFSIAKQHIAISPEIDGMLHFQEEINKAGYTQTQTLFRILWKHDIDYALLADIIAYNIEDKKDCKTFWRA